MSSAIFGVSLKWVSLVTLVVQNSALVLLMKFSKSGPKYINSTAVVMAELIKLIICLVIYFHQNPLATVKLLYFDLFGPNSAWLKMTVPALLYLIQNNLQYLAVSLLDAATFQVTYQMKILTTALFSVLLLNRSLSSTKWTSLVILTVGIALVQLPTTSDKKAIADVYQGFYGLLAVAIACILSGLAGVWFEKVLKGSVCLFHLGCFSMGSKHPIELILTYPRCINQCVYY